MDIQSERIKVEGILRRACLHFLEDLRGTVLSDSIANELSLNLDEKDGLTWFAGGLRQYLSSTVAGSTNRWKFWTLIDSIWFWYDAQDTRWKYMTDQGKLQSLLWAEEGANEILSSCTLRTSAAIAA